MFSNEVITVIVIHTLSN